MPRIPTTTASLTTPPSRTGEELSIASAQQPYAAAANLGRELQQTGETIARIGEQRQKENELRWVTEAADKLNRTLIPWQEDPANSSREDFGDAYRKFADEQIGEVLKDAPNTRAATVFKAHVTPSIDRDWRNSLQLGERNRLNNAVTAEDTNSSVSLESYRARVRMGEPEAAAESLQDDLNSKLSRITTAYGGIAPKLAANMREQGVVSAVLGAAENDPVLARKLLDSHAADVDVVKRESLLSHIEAKSESMNGVARVNAIAAWDAQRNAAWENLQPIRTQKDYTIFGKHAPDIQNDQQQKDAVVNQAIVDYADVAGKNAGAQYAALEKYRGSEDPKERAVATMLASRIDESVRQQKATPHDWLVQNNPVVAEAQTEWQNASIEASRARSDVERAALLDKARSYRGVLLDVSAHFQGHPPAGADSSYYLFRDSNDVQLMTRNEAQTYAHAMMKGGVESSDQAMMEFSSTFPPDKLGLAWSNLTTVPGEGKGLPADWQLASTISDPLVRKRVLGAAKYVKDISDLTPERKQRIEDAFKDDAWTSFSITMAGDNYQRSDWLNSYKKIVAADAVGLMMTQKLNEKDAVKHSIRDIISAQWSTQTSWNGKPFVVPVQRSDWTAGGTPKPARTQQELQNAPVVLQMSLLRLPTTLIPTESLNWISSENKKNRGDAKVEANIQKSISQAAIWKLEPDSQSYSLYVHDALRNNDFQLMDKNGKPFVVDLDKASAEQAKDVVHETYSMPSTGVSGYQTPPNQIEITRTRNPSDVPPIYQQKYTDPFWKLAFTPYLLIAEKQDVVNQPKLGAEWINQQPGMTNSPALDKALLMVNPPKKPPQKPVK